MRKRLWHWLSLRPVTVAIVLSSAIAGVGYARTEQIATSNCEEGNDRWDSVIDFLATRVQDRRELEELREAGLVDCGRWFP